MAYRQARKHLGGFGLTRFRLLRSLDGFVRSALRSDVAEVLGHRMYLDAQDSGELSVNGIYEPLTTELVEREVRAGAGVLDIGAHVGYYTLQFARLVGPGGRVYAFEPAPHNLTLLEKNLRVNGYRHVTVVAKAVADAAGAARLYVDEDNAGDCRIYDSRDGRRSYAIETVRLDDYFAGNEGSIDFIKMDIQGAEHAALRGMLGLLKRHPGARLVTEFWPFGLKTFGVGPEAYLRLLCDQGFDLWNVDQRLGRLAHTSVDELVGRYPAAFENATNLFCVRR
jgi:FkbM family methyltransferase